MTIVADSLEGAESGLLFQDFKMVNNVDNAPSLQALINNLSAQGGGFIFVSPGLSNGNTSITPKSNVTLFGNGASTIFKTTDARWFISQIDPTTPLHDWGVFDMHFIGPVTEVPTSPQRLRNGHDGSSSPLTTGMYSAMFIRGSLDPSGTYSVKSNIKFCNNIVENCSQLPILITGTTGVEVNNNRFDNNQDVGFTWNDGLVFMGNRISNSADNGVSISRGNKRITCVGNVIKNSCYNGIWMSGFPNGDGSDGPGPNNFTISGNTIWQVGQNGIMLADAPKYGAVTGNSIDCQYFRGPVDQPSNSYGGGIYISGAPINNSTVTDYADGITVAGNQIRTAPVAGILGFAGIKNAMIADNIIQDIGTQFLADGVTAILSSDTSQNVGIYFPNPGSCTNIDCWDNKCSDTRATPYFNFSMNPTTNAQIANQGMTQVGLRGSGGVTENSGVQGTKNISYVNVFTPGQKMIGGAVAGSTGGAGTIAGFDINGAAASTRLHQILTAANARWKFGGNNTPEAGANAGTDFIIAAYDDSAASLGTKFLLRRSDGRPTFPFFASAGLVATDASGNQSVQAAATAAGTVSLTNSVQSGGDTNTSSSGSGADYNHSLTYSVPANSLAANKAMRVTAVYNLTTGATAPTMIFKLKLGGTTVAVSAASACSINISNAQLTLQWLVQATAAPSGASNVTCGMITIPSACANLSNTQNQADQSLATNGALNMQLSTQWSIAGVGTNSITLKQLIVEALN